MGLGGTGILRYTAGVEGAAHPITCSPVSGGHQGPSAAVFAVAPCEPGPGVPSVQNKMILSCILVLHPSTKVNCATEAGVLPSR